MWTSGRDVNGMDSHGVPCTGRGFHSARVGIDDGMKFSPLAPGSCSTTILNIQNLTNYESNKAPGKFAFEIDNAEALLMYGAILILLLLV